MLCKNQGIDLEAYFSFYSDGQYPKYSGMLYKIYNNVSE